MKIRDVIDKILKTVPAIVAAAEKAMQDGKITAAERKEFAMAIVGLIAKEFGVELPWWARFMISIAINFAAGKLPSKDINLPPLVLGASAKINF